MPWELSDVLDPLTNPANRKNIGIALALVGAVFLALGAQFQYRGVRKVDRRHPGAESFLHIRQFLALLRRPSWLLGTTMLGCAVLLQVTSVGLAPLIVIQPLGVVALVISTLVNARFGGSTVPPSMIRSIALCVGGTVVFVLLAFLYSADRPITPPQVVAILITLAGVLVAFGLAFALLHTRLPSLAFVIGAGVLYGFVASLAKLTITQIATRDFSPLTILCVIAVLVAAALGGIFVQIAYSTGPPDMVIAGLTVIDPIIAIGIGIIVLGEASSAPPFALVGFAAAGAIAVTGVLTLSRSHPSDRASSRPAPPIDQEADARRDSLV